MDAFGVHVLGYPTWETMKYLPISSALADKVITVSPLSLTLTHLADLF